MALCPVAELRHQLQGSLCPVSKFLFPAIMMDPSLAAQVDWGRAVTAAARHIWRQRPRAPLSCAFVPHIWSARDSFPHRRRPLFIVDQILPPNDSELYYALARRRERLARKPRRLSQAPRRPRGSRPRYKATAATVGRTTCQSSGAANAGNGEEDKGCNEAANDAPEEDVFAVIVDPSVGLASGG